MLNFTTLVGMIDYVCRELGVHEEEAGFICDLANATAWSRLPDVAATDNDGHHTFVWLESHVIFVDTQEDTSYAMDI